MTIPLDPRSRDLSSELHDGPRALALPGLSVFLHWLTAILVAAMLISGVLMKQIGSGPIADALYTAHKTTGASILVIVILRVAYRAMRQLGGRWKPGAASRPVHFVLYGFLIVVPLLGWAGVSDFGARGIIFGASLPEIWPEGAGHASTLFLAHAIAAFAMLALVLVHIGLALGDFIQRGQRD